MAQWLTASTSEALSSTSLEEPSGALSTYTMTYLSGLPPLTALLTASSASPLLLKSLAKHKRGPR